MQAEVAKGGAGVSLMPNAAWFCSATDKPLDVSLLESRTKLLAVLVITLPGSAQCTLVSTVCQAPKFWDLTLVSTEV